MTADNPNKIPLTGLTGSNPLGAMAAFGLLRILSLDEQHAGTRLSWTFTTDWHAVLHSNTLDAESLVEWLLEFQAGRADSDFLEWNRDIKVQPDMFRDHLLNARSRLIESTISERSSATERCDFLAAFGSESVLQKGGSGKGCVKPTAFHMSAGKQMFLDAVRKAKQFTDVAWIDPKRKKQKPRVDACRSVLREALFGPWKRSDKCQSLNWDPATEATHALSYEKPTDAGVFSTVGAVSLAIESLPLFTACPAGDSLHTSGFNRSGNEFRWPIWETPLTFTTTAALLRHPLVYCSTTDSRSPIDRALLGVVSVFASLRIADSNGKNTFRNSTLV